MGLHAVMRFLSRETPETPPKQAYERKREAPVEEFRV